LGPLLYWRLSKAGQFSSLAAAFRETEDYFNTPLPEPVRSKLSSLTDRHQDLVKLKQTRPATHILLEYQKLRSLDWHGRARLVLALAFPTPAYMRWRYQLLKYFKIPVATPTAQQIILTTLACTWQILEN
jgi:hypothetical protein